MIDEVKFFYLPMLWSKASLNRSEIAPSAGEA